MDNLYAQFDENGICMCVGEPNVTGIVATYDCLGKMYIDDEWLYPEDLMAKCPVCNTVVEGLDVCPSCGLNIVELM